MKTSAYLSYFLALLPLIAGPQASAATEINDSLVSHLACATLTKDNVLLAVDRSKWKLENQIPLKNWGANLVAHCWALAVAQRKFTYLLRTDIAGARTTKKDLVSGLDQVRGYRMDQCDQNTVGSLGSSANSCAELPVASRVIEIPEQNLTESPLYKAWFGSQVGSFKKAIEDKQQRLLYALDAERMGLMSDSLVPNTTRSSAVFKKVKASFARGEAPLLILRKRILAQHVVMVKGIEKDNETHFRLAIYDSNYPSEDLSIDFKDGLFYAAASIYLLGENNPTQAIDIVMTGSEDMQSIRDTLFSYYAKKCAAAGQ